MLKSKINNFILTAICILSQFSVKVSANSEYVTYQELDDQSKLSYIIHNFPEIYNFCRNQLWKNNSNLEGILFLQPTHSWNLSERQGNGEIRKNSSNQLLSIKNNLKFSDDVSSSWSKSEYVLFKSFIFNNNIIQKTGCKDANGLGSFKEGTYKGQIPISSYSKSNFSICLVLFFERQEIPRYIEYIKSELSSEQYKDFVKYLPSDDCLRKKLIYLKMVAYEIKKSQ